MRASTPTGIIREKRNREKQKPKFPVEVRRIAVLLVLEMPP